jgi:glycosyltransferase involved in cell wall biosynthesis
MRHILVAMNNFWVGGRETFVETCLAALRPRGVTADLLCTTLQDGGRHTSIFGQAVQCSAADESQRCRAWLEEGRRLVERRRPDLVWAHHFDLLPAWLVARTHQVPLLTTFHGPLTSGTRPNDLFQALGMTLAIHQGDAVSGVSQEVLGDLDALGARRPVRLVPNAVEPPASPASPGRWPPRRLLLVSRSEKLEHLRAVVRFFAAYRQRKPGARLRIVAGSSPSEAPARGTIGSMQQGLLKLGGRWCRAEGWTVLASLPYIEWAGYSATPRELMRESDLVFGMGRVVLEALAEQRPAFLVGYEHLHGLVTSASFERQRRANLSGRGEAPVTPAEACSEVLGERPSLPQPPAPEDTLRVFAPPIERSADADALATAATASLRGGASAPRLFAEIAASLSSVELQSLYALARG